MRFLEKRAALGIANREISRLNRSRIYGIVRLIFTAIGERFAQDGIIEDAEDVFWLTVEEVFETVRQSAGEQGVDKQGVDGHVMDDHITYDHGADGYATDRQISDGYANGRKEKIAERKKQYQMYEKLPAYSRLIFAENEFDKHPATVNAYKPRREDAFLQGVPCSNGEVTAEALVIEDIKEIKDNLLKMILFKIRCI